MDSEYDITGKIGDLLPQRNKVEWPMFSYSRPASIFWNAVAAELDDRSWSEDDIRELLQSKQMRHALDSRLGEQLMLLGRAFAKEIDET